MKICSVEECTREVCAKGLCRPHYRRAQIYGSPTDGVRFRTVLAPEPCGVQECSSPRHAKGYCRRHYERYTKHGTTEERPRYAPTKSLADKLAEGTPTGLPDTECWEWTKTRDAEGYGRITRAGGVYRAHRVSYEHANDTKIPTGLMIRHMCDNPPCVNPGHLKTGSNLDNMRDRADRGRSAKGEASGQSKLTEAEVLCIRKMYADGSTGVALAKEFGIEPATVSQIVLRKTWKHI